MAFDNKDDNTPDLPDTAPTEETLPFHEEEPFWGKLIQFTSQGHNTRVLTEECYRIGRVTSCELPVTVDDFGQEIFSKISKLHCRLFRCVLDDQPIVFLEDLSLNGTFVNKKKVGKNVKIILDNTAEISLAAPSMAMYMYIDNNGSSSGIDWLHNSMISQFYTLKHLGSGMFGDVRLVLDKQSYRRYAMKKISKDKVPETRIFNEVKILRRLNHPFVVNVKCVFDTPEAVFITLEYMAGGNLLSRIKKLRKIPEFECKSIFYQIFLGVEYLHEEGIIHRDLKPENVLVNEIDLNYVTVKITDFGLSKVIDSNTELRSMCGTMRYMAPEILGRYAPTYNSKADIWSLGVMLFLCLSGEYPFNGTQHALANQITAGKYEMTTSGWHLISKSAKHCVKKMLVIDPMKRLSIADIFDHPWLKDERIKFRVEACFNSSSSGDITL